MAELGSLFIKVLPILIIIGLQYVAENNKKKRKQRQQQLEKQAFHEEPVRGNHSAKTGNYTTKTQLTTQKTTRRKTPWGSWLESLEAELEHQLQEVEKWNQNRGEEREQFSESKSPISQSSMAPQILEPQQLEAEESLPYDKDASQRNRNLSQGKGIFDGQRGAVSMTWDKVKPEQYEIFTKKSGSVADLWEKQEQKAMSKSAFDAHDFHHKEKLRHAIIMKEILEPPVSLRR